MENKVGVISTTYSHYDLKDALEGITGAGFKYIELATIFFPGQLYKDHVFDERGDYKKCAELCKKFNVEIIAICAHGRLMKDDGIKRFKKCIDVANDLGVWCVSTGTGEIKSENDKKRFYNDIRILGEYAAKKDVMICIEIHNAWFSNGKAANQIINEIGMDNIKINYDTANVIFYGDTRPENDIKYALDNIAHLHLKDKRGGYKVWDFPALGEGEIDFNVIINALKDYDGSICVEIEFDGKQHPLEELNKAVKKSYEFLRNFDLTL